MLKLLEYWREIILLAALLLLAGYFWFFSTSEALLPFRAVPNDEVRLIVRKPEQDPVNMEALVLGRLWIVDGCLKIGATAQEARTAVWRSGFRVGEDAKGLFVYHPANQARHRIGARVQFGGGYVEILEPKWTAERIEEGNLRGCSGPFVFVGSTGD